MGKNKRQKKKTAYICCEGKRERLILSVFDQLYLPAKNNINIMYDLINGGNADGIVSKALKNNGRDKVSAWLDEDFEFKNPLSKEIKNQLAKCWSVPKTKIEEFHACKLRNLQTNYNQHYKKPCLIVSQPACVEGLILKILGYHLPFQDNEFNSEDCKKQVKNLKNTLSGIINKEEELSFYQKKITRDLLEDKKSIPEVKLLIYMLTNL